MKIFQSTRRILAAQIIGVLAHESGEKFMLQTEHEQVEVAKSWIEQFNPEIGGYVTIDPLAGGITAYVSARDLLTTHVHVGDIALNQPEAPVTGAGSPMPDPVPEPKREAAPSKPAKQKPIRATRKARK